MVFEGAGGSAKGKRQAHLKQQIGSRQAKFQAATQAGTAKPTYGSMAHVDNAFAKSKGAKDNFVTLHAFRQNMGGTRAQQDAVIRAHRLGGRFSLDSHEGLADKKLSQHEKDASIHEGGSRLVYISRRNGG